MKTEANKPIYPGCCDINDAASIMVAEIFMIQMKFLCCYCCFCELLSNSR